MGCGSLWGQVSDHSDDEGPMRRGQVCFDFDLCDNCYSQQVEPGEHLAIHPTMICFRDSDGIYKYPHATTN